MTRPDVVVVRTGVANLASVVAGLNRAGAAVCISADPEEILLAGRVVLPGVGAFGPAMEGLRRNGLDLALNSRCADGKALLAICLGLHLLADGSEETPGVAGLGAIPGVARRFTGAVRAPQLGWNRVEPEDGCALLTGGFATFANSYRLETAPEGFHAAFADHGGRFVAGLERGSLLACQFHPELSGSWGLALLQRWLRAGETC